MRRFDPGQVAANCPACGAITGAKKGEPTPPHQPQGSRETCGGVGRPAQ